MEYRTLTSKLFKTSVGRWGSHVGDLHLVLHETKIELCAIVFSTMWC